MVFFILNSLVFYTELVHLAQKLKKKKKKNLVGRTRGTKLNLNWNSIFTVN